MKWFWKNSFETNDSPCGDKWRNTHQLRQRFRKCRAIIGQWSQQSVPTKTLLSFPPAWWWYKKWHGIAGWLNLERYKRGLVTSDSLELVQLYCKELPSLRRRPWAEFYFTYQMTKVQFQIIQLLRLSDSITLSGGIMDPTKWMGGNPESNPIPITGVLTFLVLLIGQGKRK